MNDSPPEPPRSVDVSVVIPVDDISSGDLAECLASLREQGFDSGYEVIVVEGGNISQARNEGLRRSGGEYVAFMDSDCVAPQDWLKKMKISINEVDAAGVGGAGISPKDSSLYSEAIDMVYQSYLGSLGSTSLCRTGKVVPAMSLSTSNCIYRHEVLRLVGGFDEKFSLNEDTDLSARVRKLGFTLYFTPDFEVIHKRENSFRSFIVKFYTWGRSRMRAMLTSSRLIDLKILFLLVYWATVTLSSIITIRYLALSLLLYIGLLTLHGVIFSVRRGRPEFMLLVPSLYLAQHVGYLLGLLSGLIAGRYRPPDMVESFTVIHEKF